MDEPFNKNPEPLDEIFALKSELQAKEIEIEDFLRKKEHMVFDYEGQIRELQLEL